MQILLKNDRSLSPPGMAMEQFRDSSVLPSCSFAKLSSSTSVPPIEISCRILRRPLSKVSFPASDHNSCVTYASRKHPGFIMYCEPIIRRNHASPLVSIHRVWTESAMQLAPDQDLQSLFTCCIYENGSSTAANNFGEIIQHSSLHHFA